MIAFHPHALAFLSWQILHKRWQIAVHLRVIDLIWELVASIDSEKILGLAPSVCYLSIAKIHPTHSHSLQVIFISGSTSSQARKLLSNLNQSRPNIPNLNMNQKSTKLLQVALVYLSSDGLVRNAITMLWSSTPLFRLSRISSISAVASSAWPWRPFFYLQTSWFVHLLSWYSCSFSHCLQSDLLHRVHSLLEFHSSRYQAW